MNGQRQGRQSFHDELDALEGTLLEMAGLVERLVAEASEAVLVRDAAAAKRIRAEDHRVDELEVEIDERVVELLALQQPMASVLRQIIATNKVSNDLERVGDHAVSMAKAARRMADAQPFPEIRELSEMMEIARGMLSNALATNIAEDVVFLVEGRTIKHGHDNGSDRWFNADPRPR